MEIIKINLKNPDLKTINKVAQILKNGGVVVYPTDTCYGMGSDITQPKAVETIYKIKGRSFNKPLSVIVKNVAQIKKFAEVNKTQEKYLKKYLPGEVTFVLQKKDLETFNQETIGFRIPKFKLTQMIADKVSFPYATTSANISGYEACYTIEEIIKQFADKKLQPDLVLDAGKLMQNIPSTVVDLTNIPIKVIRQGKIIMKELK